MSSQRLEAVLATLLPAQGPWPSGAMVAGVVAADLAANPQHEAALAWLLAALPAEFAAGDEDVLRQVEEMVPERFGTVVDAAYLAYYTDPAVRAVLERETGYEARPPQPLGYELPPFDERLLERQRARAPFWRDTEQ